MLSCQEGSLFEAWTRWPYTQSSACSSENKIKCGTLHKPHRGMQHCDVDLCQNRLTPGSLIESHNRDKSQSVSSNFQFPTNTSAELYGNGGAQIIRVIKYKFLFSSFEEILE